MTTASKLNYKVDSLFLLVGGNPLPNAIAGRWLTTKDACIYLVHSNETRPVAIRLRDWLISKGTTCEPVRVDEESEPISIKNALLPVLKNLDTSKKIGLNYTGGKKAMAVHSYRTVEKWAGKNNVKPSFSYLDADTMEMLIDPDADGTTTGRKLNLGPVEMSLDDLVKLHGRSLEYPPYETPFLPESARQIALAYANGYGSLWCEWKKQELYKSKKENQWLSKGKSQWKTLSIELPDAPELKSIRDSIIFELELNAPVVNLWPVADYYRHQFGWMNPRELALWFDGKWLEHYVLQCLINLRDAGAVHWCGQNINSGFDLDVAALCGYRLYGFSCGTATDPGAQSELKKKLFEVYHRVRQLGGDQAPSALVCCSDEGSNIEKEIKRDVSVNERLVRVFDQRYLENLQEHLRSWIQ